MRPYLALTLVLIAASASAQVKYRPDGLFRNGWSERTLVPGTWEVKGGSGEHEGGVAVALYRAAELALADGAREVRVTRQQVRGITTRLRGSYAEIGYHERATVTVHAVHGPGDRVGCDMLDASRCMTLDVAGLMARFGPVLGRAAPPGAVPVAIVTGPFPPAEIGRIDARALAAAALARYRGTLSPWPAQPVGQRSSVNTGAVSATAAFAPAQRMPHLALPITELSPDEELAARLKAAQPVRGRERAQGWTVSD